MTDITKNVLSKELAFFEKKKSEFLKTYKNQFILIKGNQLINAFTTETEAYKFGVEKYGNDPFLIKQVLGKEEAITIPALTIVAIHVSL